MTLSTSTAVVVSGLLIALAIVAAIWFLRPPLYELETFGDGAIVRMNRVDGSLQGCFVQSAIEGVNGPTIECFDSNGNRGSWPGTDWGGPRIEPSKTLGASLGAFCVLEKTGLGA